MNNNFDLHIIKVKYFGSKIYTNLLLLRINGVILWEEQLKFKSWSLSLYKEQWIQGLRRIKSQPTSCLVVSYVVPENRDWPGVMLLVLYKEGESLHIQPRLLMSDMYVEMLKKQKFTMQSCYDFILPKKTHNIDGHELLILSCKYDPIEIDNVIAKLDGSKEKSIKFLLNKKTRLNKQLK